MTAQPRNTALKPVRQLAWLLLVLSPCAFGQPGPESTVKGPFVLPPVEPHVVTKDLRLLPKVDPRGTPGLVRTVPRRRPVFELPTPIPRPAPDPVVQRGRAAVRRGPTPRLNFDGAATGALPPDTIGDVGPNHFVQMVNTTFTVYDKQGAVLAGPSLINSLWSGFGGPCESQNAGDPVVVYDPLADRWLLSQFAGPSEECVAVSQGPDPVTDGFFLYQFSVPQFPDYPKIAVWPDAYYMGANSSPGVFAMDRAQMLVGGAASIIWFEVAGVGFHSVMMPSDLDGSTPPPAGSPNVFYRHVDGDFVGGADRLEIFEFHVDYATPESSTLTGPASLPTANFASLCNFSLDCIAQPNTGQGLDSITEWPMWRFAYRNLGTHEALLANHAVNVGDDQAGVRWYELRRSGGGSWSIHQQSTYAPDADSRWMASIAMDRAGNIALAYNVSSDSVFPSLRYTGRLRDDAPGSMTLAEETAVSGGGSQLAANRWGDYSALGVDPADDCTFWFTGEYQPAAGTGKYRTRIFSFKFEQCGTIFADGFESGGVAEWTSAVGAAEAASPLQVLW